MNNEKLKQIVHLVNEITGRDINAKIPLCEFFDAIIEALEKKRDATFAEVRGDFGN